MGKKLYPADTLKQARNILIAWDQIDPSLTFGSLTPENLSADVATVEALRERIIFLQVELLDLRNQRDGACIGIWDKVKRVRTGVKGFYGDDSTRYELAGSTRRKILTNG